MFSKIKSRKSVVVLIIVSFWVLYVTIGALQFYYEAQDLAAKEIERRQRDLIYVQESLTPFLISKNMSLLKDRLEKSMQSHFINFYLLKQNGQVVMWGHPRNNLSLIDADYPPSKDIMKVIGASYRNIKIFDYSFMVGINEDHNVLVWEMAKSIKYAFIRDVVVVTLMLGLIVYVLLKDIVSITQVLESRGRSKLKNITSLSKEGLTLLKATTSYEASAQNLAEENQFFSGSLTPAILLEMKSGQKPPYAFQSTMARLDLNGYTQLFLEKKDEYVTDILHDYFAQAREMIERYGGFIYQYVGDEIVFHVKEEKDKNSLALVFAIMRSVFQIAQQVEQGLPPGADHYFKLKGSFTIGKVRFVKQDSGFSLSGLPLIESARLLSQVDVRDKSSVTLYTETANTLKDLGTFSESKETLLKGFTTPARFCQAVDFTSAKDILAQRNLHLLTYFRTDEDLIQVYDFLKKDLEAGQDESFFAVFNILKSYSLKTTSDAQLNAFSSLLSTVMDLNEKTLLGDKVLASAISLCSHMVPTSLANDEIIQLLNKNLQHNNPRIQANTIIVLGDLAKDISFLHKFIYSQHNRVSADAMLVTGKKEIDKELAQRLEAFLDSQNPLFKASGAWVVRQLVEYYKSQDMVFYNTNPYLKKLEEKIAA